MTPANMQYMFVRSLRVFRVMRLAAASENLREVLMSAARSLKVIGAIAVVLLMFLYFMAIIAMQLFGGIWGDGGIDAHGQGLHFDYFIIAFFNIFIVITTENWIGFMWTTYDNMGVGAIIFFVVVVIFGAIVILNMFLAILLDQMDDELKSKVRRMESERMKNEFVENRAARQMQNMARAGRFAKKLLAKSRESSVEDKYRARASGRTTGFAEQNTEFPLLSNWEISTYTIMWNTTTKETGGKLPIKSLQSFLVLIGQRLEHAPERVARDDEATGMVELWEILKVVNRKRVKEIQVARKKKPGALGEEDLAKAQLPKRSLCFDANV